VWINAAFNKHYLVALTSLMVLVGLSFQPLAAAMFSVRDTERTLPGTLSFSFPSRYGIQWLNTYERHDCQYDTANRTQSESTVSGSDELADEFIVPWISSLNISYLAFLGAASYASASIIYNINAVPFVKDGYTTASFDVSAAYEVGYTTTC